MKFVWKGSKSAPEAKTLTVKVGGNAPIVFTKDVPYQFQHDAHYRPYKPRMESLIRDQSSGFALLAREYPPRVFSHTIAANTKAPKPAPANHVLMEVPADSVDVTPKLPITSVQDFTEAAREKVKADKLNAVATAKRLARNAVQAKAAGKKTPLAKPLDHDDPSGEPLTTENQVPSSPEDDALMNADRDVLSKSVPELRAILKGRGLDTDANATKAELLDLL